MSTTIGKYVNWSLAIACIIVVFCEAGLILWSNSQWDARTLERLDLTNVEFLNAKTVNVTLYNAGVNPVTVNEISIHGKLVAYRGNLLAHPATLQPNSQATLSLHPFISFGSAGDTYVIQVMTGHDKLFTYSAREELNVTDVKQLNITIANTGANTTVTITGIYVDSRSLNYLASRVTVPPNSVVTFSFLYGLPWIAGYNHTIHIETERGNLLNYTYTPSAPP